MILPKRESAQAVQLYLKPLATLKKVRAFDLDDAKSRFLVLETGYRYVCEPNAPTENRMIAAVTFNLPMKAGFSMSDRNRADLDWKSGNFTWRYRNKLQVERTIAVRSYHLIPYVAVEPYYESQYNKWSTTALYAGSVFPVGKHVEFNLYYEHENNTGGSRRFGRLSHAGHRFGLAHTGRRHRQARAALDRQFDPAIELLVTVPTPPLRGRPMGFFGSALDRFVGGQGVGLQGLVLGANSSGTDAAADGQR